MSWRTGWGRLRRSWWDWSERREESLHDDYIHARFLTLANLREAINKLEYEGVDFGGLRVEPAGFVAAVAKCLAKYKASLRNLTK